MLNFDFKFKPGSEQVLDLFRGLLLVMFKESSLLSLVLTGYKYFYLDSLPLFPVSGFRKSET